MNTNFSGVVEKLAPAVGTAPLAASIEIAERRRRAPGNSAAAMSYGAVTGRFLSI